MKRFQELSFSLLAQLIPSLSLITVFWLQEFLISMVIPPSLFNLTLYYWTLYRPDKVSIILLMTLGLLTDILRFDPLGVTAILNLVFFSMSLSYRRLMIGQPFSVTWAGCSFGIMIVNISYQLIHWILTGNAPLFLLGTVLTIFLYPLWARIMITVHRLMNHVLVNYG